MATSTLKYKRFPAHKSESEKQPLLKRSRKRRTSVTASFSATLEAIPENRAKSFTTEIKEEDLPGKRRKKIILSIFLTLLTVLSTVTFGISVPLYVASFKDGFIAILLVAFWFPPLFFFQVLLFKLFIDPSIVLKSSAPWSNVFMVGFAIALNGIMLAYTSDPNRTPPYLQARIFHPIRMKDLSFFSPMMIHEDMIKGEKTQFVYAILQTLVIPYTVFIRYLMLGKGINVKQALCLLTLFAGILISLLPQFTIPQTAAATNVTNDVTRPAKEWYFPFTYALSYLPLAFGLTLMEKNTMVHKANTVVYIAWAQVFLYGTYILLFWTDFLPKFGYANGTQDFANSVKKGLACLYTNSSDCKSVLPTAIVFMISYCISNMCNILLIKHAQGAIYVAVSTALVMPLGTIFWTLFTPDLKWQPQFSSSMWFVVLALIIMVPSTFLYSIFGNLSSPKSAYKSYQHSQVRLRRSSRGYRTIPRSNSSPNLYKVLL
ncbi:DgyrCDS396 [Dimorphilus gyrociliatus]|uniref:DgyrCDS396 n=1 Tax=Dimorphilus gyrociliatus TaxID=2664684 RepID=A0A7I8V4C1_9ANNE|nr:DgyrCDS396 [Dimorphilus gyrociliatus]